MGDNQGNYTWASVSLHLTIKMPLVAKHHWSGSWAGPTRLETKILAHFLSLSHSGFTKGLQHQNVWHHWKSTCAVVSTLQPPWAFLEHHLEGYSIHYDLGKQRSHYPINMSSSSWIFVKLSLKIHKTVLLNSFGASRLQSLIWMQVLLY